MDARLRRRRDQLGRIGILLERAMYCSLEQLHFLSSGGSPTRAPNTSELPLIERRRQSSRIVLRAGFRTPIRARASGGQPDVLGAGSAIRSSSTGAATRASESRCQLCPRGDEDDDCSFAIASSTGAKAEAGEG